MPVPTHFRAVLFDLDGTLADTLADLANAVNHALATLGLPPHPQPAYRYFVGDGARNLITRALPPDRQDLVEPALARMRAHYDAHCFDETRLYPGIPELVAELHRRRYKLAVFSNKPDEFTKRMVAHYFPTNPFDTVLGHITGIPLKPDPAGAFRIAADLGVPTTHWLYLGDTNTDMLTARAAGMYPVGVLWGFRDRAELEATGARTILAQPGELLRALAVVP
jgi:phosphoglycolate phosphatase